ncbi:hypothetical protein [uncultured Marinobacter sp.]|uniref:hypothetical protein n=1 Tax=uncultured Marinobacter sp. TaxID=187379 RepID=UPI0030DA7F6F
MDMPPPVCSQSTRFPDLLRTFVHARGPAENRERREHPQLIELTVVFTLTFLYLALKRDEPFELQVIYAIAFMPTYLVVCLFLPPQLAITTNHLGQAFGYGRAVSFGAILFPELNTRSPIAVTRFLGWFGLVVVLVGFLSRGYAACMYRVTSGKTTQKRFSNTFVTMALVC